MKRLHIGTPVGWSVVLLGMAAILVLALWQGTTPQTLRAAKERPMPAFTHTQPNNWINSRPLTKKDIEGRVTLLVVWTTI